MLQYYGLEFNFVCVYPECVKIRLSSRCVWLRMDVANERLLTFDVKSDKVTEYISSQPILKAKTHSKLEYTQEN